MLLSHFAVLQSSGSQGLMGFVPLILVFAIFYFFMIAPARKRQKEHQAMLDALKKGDKVITNGGLHGEVVSVDGPAAILKIADNVKVKVSKSGIGALESEGGSRGDGS